MPISNSDYFFMANGEIKLKITAKKRKYPLSLKDNTEEFKRESHELSNIKSFCNEYELTYPLRKGDVLVAQFWGSSGAEMQKEHFVVVLVDSKENNPIVSVAPLTSFKGLLNLNPASDILLGIIPGIMNGKQSVAVVNQIQAIDKVRFLDPKVLSRPDSVFEANKVANKEEVPLQLKNIYRLNKKQIKDLQKAIVEFFCCGFITHNYSD